MRLEKYTQNKNGIHCYNLEKFASSFSEWENMVGVDCNSLGNFTTIFYEWNNIQHVNLPIMGQFVILRWKNGQIKRKYVRSIIDTERSIIDTFATTVKCPQIYRIYKKIKIFLLSSRLHQTNPVIYAFIQLFTPSRLQKAIEKICKNSLWLRNDTFQKLVWEHECLHYLEIQAPLICLIQKLLASCRDWEIHLFTYKSCFTVYILTQLCNTNM